MPEVKQSFIDAPTIKVGPEDVIPSDPQPASEKKSVVISKSSITTKLKIEKSRSSGKTQPANEKRYDVGELLGSGGYGQVFAVKDRDLQRDIAIKITDTEQGENTDTIIEFTNEARIMAELEHPNIVPIYDIDIEEDGKIYLCTRKISGVSLKELLDKIQKNKIPETIDGPNDVVSIGLKVCDALSYAHSKGRLHLDIKPDNIMIGQFGEVFLIDWGSSSSESEYVHATPGYMAPEQAALDDPDQRTDVYCLGATLFHTLYHRLPTFAKTPTELFEKKRRGIIDPLIAIEKKCSCGSRSNYYEGSGSEPG